MENGRNPARHKSITQISNCTDPTVNSVYSSEQGMVYTVSPPCQDDEQVRAVRDDGRSFLCFMV